MRGEVFAEPEHFFGFKPSNRCVIQGGNGDMIKVYMKRQKAGHSGYHLAPRATTLVRD